MDPFYLAILLYCAAVVVAFVDIFVPSGGMLLVMALASALAAILFGFRSGTTMGMSMLTIVIASIPAFAFIAVKIWPQTPIGKRIILGLPNSQPHSTENTQHHSAADLIGLVVRAEAPLMPTGQIRVGHRYHNAVAESGIVEVGQHVEVIGLKERNLVVRITQAAVTATIKQRLEKTTPSADENSEEENLLDRPAEEFGLESFEQ